MASTLRERLTPFLAALRHRDIELRAYPRTGEIDKALATGTVWLSWCHRGERAPVLAMDLLALLRAIDYDEWLSVLKELWPGAMDLWSQVFQERTFRLGCEVVAYELIHTTCGPFFESIAEGEVSDDCKRIHQEMETRYEILRRQGKIADAEAPVRVVYGSVGQNGDPFWRGCLRLATAQVARDEADDGDHQGVYKAWRLLFRFQEINVQVFTAAWDIKNVLSAKEVAACGVSVYPLPLCEQKVSNKTAEWVVPLMQCVLATNDGDGQEDHRGGSKAVSVHGRATLQTIDSVMSAVFASQSTQEIRVDARTSGDVPSQVRLWQWIALIVFSDMASGMVKTLTFMSESLTMELVQAIELMLREADPMAALFGRESPTDKAATKFSPTRSLTASKFFLQQPPEKGPSSRAPRLQFPNPRQNIRILNEDGNSSKLCLLPGGGPAWVMKADAVVGDESTKKQPEDKPTIHLVIDSASPTNQEVYLALLRVIGHRLHKITVIDAPWPRQVSLSPTTLRDIFSFCPALEDLNLGVMSVEAFETIASCYQDGSCRLRSLDLWAAAEGTVDQVPRFFEQLGDMQHPMAKRLTTLKLDVDFHADVRSSMVRMLDTNKRLEVFELSYSSTLIDFSITPAHFSRHNHEPLNWVAEPLDIPVRLAFLSVVQRGEVGLPTKHAVQSLACDAITHIFQFAAARRRRLVRVQL